MIIFWGSSQDIPFLVNLEVSGLDKILHIAEYAVLGFLLARAVAGPAKKISVATLVFTTFIIGTLYGLTDEFHQYFTPGRTVSILDLLSDSIGSFLGAVTFIAFNKKIAFGEGAGLR
jgi:VanZ family protein